VSIPKIHKENCLALLHNHITHKMPKILSALEQIVEGQKIKEDLTKLLDQLGTPPPQEGSKK